MLVIMRIRRMIVMTILLSPPPIIIIFVDKMWNYFREFYRLN
jgi:hypothetical protein